jgi:hypothetical protein
MTRSACVSRRSVAALAAAAVVAVAVATPSPAAAPQAHAARSCTPPKYPGDGYFTSLLVTGTTCARGKEVALAYYRCRTKTGRRGRCHRRVLRYTCREERTSIPTEINARVTCRRGGAKVVHTYQQNT